MISRDLTETDLNFLLDGGIDLLCQEATENMTAGELLRGLIRDGVEDGSEEWNARCDHWDFHCKQWNRGEVLDFMRRQVKAMINQLRNANMSNITDEVVHDRILRLVFADIQRLLVIKEQIDGEMFAWEAEQVGCCGCGCC